MGQPRKEGWRGTVKESEIKKERFGCQATKENGA